ncbi:hypothetical protein GALMADRAFT_137133 [Galerina marginata CBS 339.88]|uniref:Uncharacterized protein n=1 Tax=Galerina marginata (strain CBS 339.88) TaxID=685588 RepID=A0A067T7S9_GALM3|nr:hypothetical protein GALMADRAFT_137133 [Galerina marginata CBS 339.88]
MEPNSETASSHCNHQGFTLRSGSLTNANGDKPKLLQGIPNEFLSNGFLNDGIVSSNCPPPAQAMSSLQRIPEPVAQDHYFLRELTCYDDGIDTAPVNSLSHSYFSLPANHRVPQYQAATPWSVPNSWTEPVATLQSTVYLPPNHPPPSYLSTRPCAVQSSSGTPSLVYPPDQPPASHLTARPCSSHGSVATQSMVCPPNHIQHHLVSRPRSSYSSRAASGMAYPADPPQLPDLSARRRPRHNLTATPTMESHNVSPPSDLVTEPRQRNNSVVRSPNSLNPPTHGHHPYRSALRPRRNNQSVATPAPQVDSSFSRPTPLNVSTMRPPIYNLVPTHPSSVNFLPPPNYRRPAPRLPIINLPDHSYNVGDHNPMLAHTQPHITVSTREYGRQSDVHYSGVNLGALGSNDFQGPSNTFTGSNFQGSYVEGSVIYSAPRNSEAQHCYSNAAASVIAPCPQNHFIRDDDRYRLDSEDTIYPSTSDTTTGPGIDSPSSYFR